MRSSSASEKHGESSYNGRNIEGLEPLMSNSCCCPAALQECLPEDHLAYFISDFREDHLAALAESCHQTPEL